MQNSVILINMREATSAEMSVFIYFLEQKDTIWVEWKGLRERFCQIYLDTLILFFTGCIINIEVACLHVVLILSRMPHIVYC
jgi:hypothetical protein